MVRQQSLVMCLRPCTPRSLTEPVSFGVIDPSRRVSRAELDRLDRLWREKQNRNGTAIQARVTPSTSSSAAPRASIDSDMTRVEGCDNYIRPSISIQQPVTSPAAATTTTRNRSQSIKTWLFPRRQQASAAV